MRFHLPAGWSGRYVVPYWAISVRERHSYEINIQASRGVFFILSVCLLLSWENFQEASSLFVCSAEAICVPCSLCCFEDFFLPVAFHFFLFLFFQFFIFPLREKNYLLHWHALIKAIFWYLVTEVFDVSLTRPWNAWSVHRDRICWTQCFVNEGTQCRSSSWIWNAHDATSVDFGTQMNPVMC